MRTSTLIGTDPTGSAAPVLRALAVAALLAAAPAAAAGDGEPSVRRDLYADAFGWSRVDGANRDRDLVPTLRLRALWQPWERVNLELYGVAQVTRELGTAGFSLGYVHADNRALLGAGVLATVWDRRAGVFVQAGPALNLVDDRRSDVSLDVRGGAFLGLESARCAPAGRRGLVLVPCAELYSEVVFLSRFDRDVVAFGRGRAGATWLVTGPVAWQLLGEVRGAADRADHFYDNYADAGVLHRWRTLRPLRVDLLLGASVGRYRGVEAEDPAPDPLRYADLRLLAVTYLEF